MWDKIKNYLGYAWASPLTLLGATYTSLFTLLGWYSWQGVRGDALVWTTCLKQCPGLIQNYWSSWGGHAVGNVIVLNEKHSDKPMILLHEQKHVDQMMRLGIFQPILYGMCYLFIKIGCQGSDPYFDNPFEIDARRAAGQIVDVVGMRKKILENKKP